MTGVAGRKREDAMELCAAIGFYVPVCAAMLALRHAARADRELWSGKRR